MQVELWPRRIVCKTDTLDPFGLQRDDTIFYRINVKGKYSGRAVAD